MNISYQTEKTFGLIFDRLISFGQFVSPRGQKVIEIENFTYTIPPFVRFVSFQARKINLQYIKKEFLWYLKGDKFDTSILNEAKMWADLVNTDGTIFSNYGQYIFAGSNQFDNVVKTLVSDKDSRRASMVILGNEHLFADTKDVPCTYALNFRIRNNKLNMSVHMRSQDAIFGMTNDCPAFSFIHEMIYNTMLHYYPEIEYGMYHHIADSFHVYERHFKMLENLTGIDIETKEKKKDWSPDPLIEIQCPKISGPDEVDFLRKLDFSEIPDKFRFTKWLVQ
jgi:thymidylate synthase